MNATTGCTHISGSRMLSASWDSPAQLIDRRELTPTDREWIEAAAFEGGLTPLAYDVASSEGLILSTPCGQGLADVYTDGRYWHLPGSVISPDGLLPTMLDWVKRSADAQRRIVSVYSVDPEHVQHFHDAGFSVTKLGEEPILDLGNIDWRGRSYEWVRRQTHACRRAGLEVVEIEQAEDQRRLADELTSIFAEDLKDRVYSRPLQLLEGRFNSHELQRRRLWVVRDAEAGTIHGFLAASPIRGGQGWAFETYRKRTTAPQGTIAFLFRIVVDQLQSEGVRSISMCLVPGKNVHHDDGATTDSRVRWLLGMWYGRLNFLFNTAGQDYFKSRFRPRYEDRFVCVYPRVTCFSIASFLRVAGAFTPNWKNLVCRSFVKPRRNKTIVPSISAGSHGGMLLCEIKRNGESIEVLKAETSSDSVCAPLADRIPT